MTTSHKFMYVSGYTPAPRRKGWAYHQRPRGMTPQEAVRDIELRRAYVDLAKRRLQTLARAGQ